MRTRVRNRGQRPDHPRQCDQYNAAIHHVQRSGNRRPQRQEGERMRGPAVRHTQPADEHADDPGREPEHPASDTERHPGPGNPRLRMVDVGKLCRDRSPRDTDRQRPHRRVHPAGGVCRS